MRALPALVIAISLSGCLASADEPLGSTDDSQLSLDIECIGAFAVRAPEFEDVAPWLEQGFEAADAAVFLQSFGAPAPTVNRGLMAMFSEQCSAKAIQLQFLILVEPPNISVNFDANAFHWYEVKSFLTEDTYVHDLADLGFPHEIMHANVTAANLPPPAASLYSAFEFISASAGKQLVELRTSGSGESLSLDNSFVYWHVDENGTRLLEMDFQMTASLGFGACVAETTWIYEFMPACGPLPDVNDPGAASYPTAYGETIFGTIPDLFATGEYSFYPDVFPDFRHSNS
jgi:hypothetical protein